MYLLPNAAISRAVCDGRLHDKMGGTTIHAIGQRVQRRMHGFVMPIFVYACKKSTLQYILKLLKCNVNYKTNAQYSD